MSTDEIAAFEDDPLNEPVWPIFIYSAWALTTWYIDEWLGLVVLVASTGALAVAALRRTSRSDATAVPFVADFNTVLLFCSAGIAASVLLLEALGRSPELFLAGLCYAAAAGFVLHHRATARRRGVPEAGTT